MLILGPERTVAILIIYKMVYIMNDENCEHFCAFTMSLYLEPAPPPPQITEPG